MIYLISVVLSSETCENTRLILQSHISQQRIVDIREGKDYLLEVVKIKLWVM